MTLPPFLLFTPVPVRARHDGWSPERQRRFILALARGAGPDEAARGLGLSRQTAYALRARPGGDGFARAWDAALDFAGQARAAARPSRLTGGSLDAILVPRFYRGRLVGFVQREDNRGLMRTLRQLDRIVDRADSSGKAVEADRKRP